MGPQSNKYPYKRLKRRQERRRLCGDRGRGWCDVATSQRVLEPPEAGRGKDSPVEPLGRAQPCQHLDFELPASKTGRENPFCAILNHSGYGKKNFFFLFFGRAVWHMGS